jgi:hypothetical protein
MGTLRFRLLALSALAASACSSAGPAAGGANDSGSTVNDAAALDSSDVLAPGAPDAPSPDGSGDTWASWGMGFFSTYCVECHGASDPIGLNFTMQSIVIQNKLTIRCGVCNVQDPSWSCPASPHAKQFPISDMSGSNPKPSAVDRDRVVAWITAGCP